MNNNAGSSSSSSAPPPAADDPDHIPTTDAVRIMRNMLPREAEISNDAIEAIKECVSQFITFITEEARDHCKLVKRRTLGGEDVLLAMENLGFDDYIDPLTLYLRRYKEFLGRKTRSVRGGLLERRVAQQNSDPPEEIALDFPGGSFSIIPHGYGLPPPPPDFQGGFSSIIPHGYGLPPPPQDFSGGFFNIFPDSYGLPPLPPPPDFHSGQYMPEFFHPSMLGIPPAGYGVPPPHFPFGQDQIGPFGADEAGYGFPPPPFHLGQGQGQGQGQGGSFGADDVPGNGEPSFGQGKE